MLVQNLRWKKENKKEKERGTQHYQDKNEILKEMAHDRYKKLSQEEKKGREYFKNWYCNMF